MMQQMKIWTWRPKVMVGFVFAFFATAAMSLALGGICGSRADAAVANHRGLSALDTAAGVYTHRNGDTMKALFLTLRSDGTETLVSRDLTDDSIYGFSDNSTPVWRLNDGLSLFFQVPVYERDLPLETQIHAHTPV
jgi:hypothetical protein